MQRADSFWLVVFALGFLFSFAVIGVPIGLGIFLFANALLAAIWYFASRNEKRTEVEVTRAGDWFVKLLAGFYVVLTVPYLYRLDPVIIVLLVFTHIILAALIAVLASLPGAVHIIEIFSLLITPLSFVGNWIMETFKSITDLFKGNANVVKLLLKFILYAAVSLFVFILFSNLLSDADPEFKRRIQEVLNSLKLPEVTARTVGGVIVSFVLAGFITIVGYFSFLPILGTNAERVKEQWKKAFSFVFAKRSDVILPLVITIPVFCLFALYVWVQVKYLFGQDMSQVLAKYTFAEYAHRGFLELLVVGVLTYPILSWTMNRMRTEWIVPRIANFLVNTGIVGLLVVMLYSLFVRMNIYTSTYGPSVLRTYVLVGAAFVAIGLLAYEIVAILKAWKPGYTFMNALVIGDYSVLAIFTGLSLLSVLAIVPWNNIVATQLVENYRSTKKVDIFQLMELSNEAQPQVYEFAQELAKDGASDGAKILQIHALQERDDYNNFRNESLFTKVFGVNYLGNKLSSFSNADLGAERKAALTQLDESLTRIERGFFQGLVANDFEATRKYFDPLMKKNDITGFSDTTSVSIKSGHTDQYREQVLALASGSKYISRSEELNINRKSTYKIAGSNVSRTTTDSTYVYVEIGVRNGKLVIVDSSVILNYLPDAIVKMTDQNTGNVSMYGYRTFCEVPTLERIYAPSQSCETTTVGDYDVARTEPVKPFSNGGFVKSDFKTE